MARISSLNVLLTSTGKDFLAEEYGAVIENIQKNLISSKLKNTALSGTPTAGTVEAKRFVNRKSNAYGTARSAGAGQAVKAEPVVISINTDRELITEVEQKDVSLYGVDNFIQRQRAMDEKSMARELERAFFTEAQTAGTQLTLQGTAVEEKLEEMIQSIETTSNDYVDGVDRDMIALVLTPALYGKARTYFDKVSNGDANGEEFGTFHGVQCYSSTYLPAGVTEGIAMVEGAVGQPVLPTVATPEKIQLSNAYSFGMFYSYGTKAVMADLIKWA